MKKLRVGIFGAGRGVGLAKVFLLLGELIYRPLHSFFIKIADGYDLCTEKQEHLCKTYAAAGAKNTNSELFHKISP